MNRYKRITVFILALLSFIVVSKAVANGHSDETIKRFAFMTDAHARKTVTRNSANLDYANCITGSYTDNPPVNITQIGYESFGCRVERSDGMWWQWTAPSGQANYNSGSHSDTHTMFADMDISLCRKIIASGVHLFSYYDGTQYFWRPPFSNDYTYCP